MTIIREERIGNQRLLLGDCLSIMPGNRDVEKHLHEKFATSRFSGEWFVETPAMRVVFEALLTPHMPVITPREKVQKRTSGELAALSEEWMAGLREVFPRFGNNYPLCSPNLGTANLVPSRSHRLRESRIAQGGGTPLASPASRQTHQGSSRRRGMESAARKRLLLR